MKGKKQVRKVRPITLIEIMVVILLIGLISGVLAYNFSGSLNEGKKFKTQQAIMQIENILELEIAKGDVTPQEAVDNWKKIIENSALVSKPKELLTDGWGQPFTVTYDEETNKIEVRSEKLDAENEKAEKKS